MMLGELTDAELVAMVTAEPGSDENDSHVCVVCDEPYSLGAGCDPTPTCASCAHELTDVLAMRLAASAARAEAALAWQRQMRTLFHTPAEATPEDVLRDLTTLAQLLGTTTFERDRMEAAIFEAARHVLGKCDCPGGHPYGEVQCASMTERALSPFVETGGPPEYEFRLRERPRA